MNLSSATFLRIPQHPLVYPYKEMSVKKDGLTIPVCSRVEEDIRTKSFCLLQDCGGKRLVCPEKSAEG